jgi:serine/threonine protein kinase
MSNTSPIESCDGRIAVRHQDSRALSGVGVSSPGEDGGRSICDRRMLPGDSRSGGSRPGGDRTLLLNLALEDWCRRKSSGSTVSVCEFVAEFPDLRHSLENLIRVHDFIEANPDLIDRLVESSWPVAGDRFCGFDLLEELGRGASSRVFVALEPAVANRPVVVKVGPSVDREASGRGALVHPAISPIYSTSTDPSTGLTALVMPFQSRVTMFEILDRFCPVIGATPSPADIVEHIRVCNRPYREISTAVPLHSFPADYFDLVLKWAIDIAAGLDVAHTHASTHGDLKPSNILVTDAGGAVLIDFNLSQSGETSKPRSVGGTLPYMAPEQIRALLRPASKPEIDPRAADIFQFGATFAHIATGTCPLPIDRAADNATSRFEYALEHRDFAALLSRVPSIPLRRVLERCLSPDPARRPANGRELLRALEAIHNSSHARIFGGRRSPRWSAMIVPASLLALSSIWLVPRPSRHETRDLIRGNSTTGRSVETERNLDLLSGRAGVYREAIAAASRLDGQDRSAAVKSLETLAELPDAGFANAVLAYTRLVRDRDTVGSIKAGKAALAKGERSYAVLNNLGLAYIAARDLAIAESCLLESTELNVNDHRAWWNLAVIERDRALRGKVAPRTTWIDRAMQCDAPNAGVFVEAALQYAITARSQGLPGQQGEDSLRIARGHLAMAASLGAGSEQLSVPSQVLQDRFFVPVDAQAQPVRESGPIARAVDPVTSSIPKSKIRQE